MKFGTTPLAEAEGAILAHSLREGELVFKKGHVLRAADIEALATAGIDEVIAARLEPGDVQEDEAAARLARAIAGEGLEIADAFTGRVNLHAKAPGLVVVDRARVDAINAIDESVTIGTLAAFAPVAAKQMAATVKIIPFAVREGVLRRCLAIAEDDGPILRVAAYRPLRVKLVQTRLPGTKDSVLDKTVAVTAERVAAAGGRLVAEMRCAHDVEALRRRIAEAREDADLILIAGASAITDRRDVLPAAIEAAGGEVVHFGMPVDPGNLLLLAHVGEQPVLGLPGCARSPKLNGFDWVLQRVAAGLPVERAVITGMGVGGLLMEIPTRPQPREGGRSKPAVGPVVALVLAGGQSRRMGAVNKLLAEVAGKPLVAHAVDAAKGARVGEVVVVTGYERERVEAALEGRAVRFVHNPDYADGLSTSLAAGIRALGDDVAGVLVCLGDMPRVTSADLDRLIGTFDPDAARAICVPTVRGKRGNPVLFAARFFAEMLEVEGDVGARHLIGQHADQVVEIAMDDDAALVDIDTPEALDNYAGAPS